MLKLIKYIYQKESVRVLSLYLILSVLFFFPAIFSNQLIAHGDGFDSYLPLRYLLADSIHNLHLDLWIPGQLLGVPHIGILQSAVFYPLNWLYSLIFVVPFPILFNTNILIHYALGAWLMFLLCRYKLHLNTTSSIAAGLMWGFGSFNQAHRGHITVFNTAIWLPLLIYYTHDLFERPRLKSAIAIAFVLAIQVFAGFIQLFLYSFIVLAIYFLVFFWNSKKKKLLLTHGLIAIIIGFIIASPQIIQTLQYSSFSYRGRTGVDFLTDYSYNPLFFISLIVPFVLGGGYGVPLWGRFDQVGFGLYIGLISVGVVPLALLTARKNRYVIFSLLLLVISALLMFGKYSPLQGLVEQIPILGSMRIPSRHRYEFSFALILLASIGLNHILTWINKISMRKALICLIVVLGLMIFGIQFIGPRFIDLLNTARSVDHQIQYAQVAFNLDSNVFVWPYIFTTLYLFSTILIFLKRPKLFSLSLILILSIDLWFFSYKYDTSFPKFEDFSKSQKYALQQKNLLPYEAHRYWKTDYIQDGLMNIAGGTLNAGGYDSLLNLEYKNLLNLDGRGKSYNLGSLISNNSLLSMLGIKYIYIDSKRPLNYNPVTLDKNIGLEMLHWDKWVSSKPAVNMTYFLQSLPHAYDYLTQDVLLDPNTAYIFEADISAKGRQSQYFYLDLGSQGSFNDPLMPAQIFMPEEFMNVRQKYFRIFITAPGSAQIKTKARVISLSEGQIQVHKASLSRIGVLNTTISQYKEISRNSQETVIENLHVLPRIYSVSTLKPYDSINEFKHITYTQQPDFGKVAYLLKEEYLRVRKKSYHKADISNEKFGNDIISFRTNNLGSDSFIVLADIFYPGWKATVDGKDVEIHKTNGVLRGIVVPMGNHTVVFRYVPTSLYIALSFSVGAILFSVFYLVYHRKTPFRKT